MAIRLSQPLRKGPEKFLTRDGPPKIVEGFTGLSGTLERMVKVCDLRDFGTGAVRRYGWRSGAE